MRGIKVTAKTPTGNMVSFDVPSVEAQVKNRDQGDFSRFTYPPTKKVYVSGKVELKLSLLCLTANQEERRLASFDAILEGHNTNESADDVLLVELKQPYIFIHSNAIDRAVLVYLNYRTAYQSWKDEIDSVKKERPSANNNTASTTTAETPLRTVSTPASGSSKLFLKVTVHDFKIKMPLLGESHALLLVIQAIVVSGSMGDVTGFKGSFAGFELFFAAESDSAGVGEPRLNTCSVQDGELEIISETEASGDSDLAGLWHLLIRWNMQGLDVKLDTGAGALFSRLGTTLTTLTDDHSIPVEDDTPSRTRYKQLEAEYQTQQKTLEDVRTLGASAMIIEAQAAALAAIEKELKIEYMHIRKRRNDTKEVQKSSQAAAAEIALILDASVKINTGTIECYPTAAKERLSQSEEKTRNVRDAAMTLFLLPGLDVALNYQSHGTESTGNKGDRRARLISNVVIDSMPKEMAISPSFLDYLSETLDTIDAEQAGRDRQSVVKQQNTATSGASGGGGAASQGFSVDVIVHALVKPSTVLFSCQPRAKVECTLQVPQMNFVFSSTPPTELGPSGMKLTCQMSEFALRVNHPFDKNAKGCLHLSLESVAVNFIREKRNEVMVSVISEIGVATVNYDMRRLSEILAFPKAWYNRSIARRLFLGEQGARKEKSNTATTTTTANTEQERWRTAVRVSTILRELRIEMNIGNVLGKTTWINQELVYHGAFDLADNADNDVKSIVKLTKSKLESRSGLLGGSIVMEQVEGSCLWREGKTERNVKGIEVGLKELGIRIEYHSSVIILSKLTEPRLKLNDMSNDGSPQFPQKEINVQLHLTWDDFSLFMSRSSTPNFIQGARKVAEFVQGQIKSGSEALSSFFDVQKAKDIASAHDVTADEKYQRHWPPIIQMHKSIREFNLGGTSNMKGKHLTLVCFDGRDFKAENWAVFSVNTPDIYFSTDVRQEESDGGKECAIVYQSFNFTIAQSNDPLVQRDSKEHVLGAFIVRVTKTPRRRRPGAQAGVREWNQYAVPEIDQHKPEEKKADDIHVIFAIPQIEIQLKTTQGQEMRLPAFPEAQKVVCTFSAEFRQELKVTMVPGQIFFLKRFITEYVRENMSVMDEMADSLGDQGEEAIHASYNDERDYVCRTWQLEPKLRFLYWNSALEAPGIDAILQRLGFTHARVTIPKWFQRGMLDKLDSTHANLAKQIIQLRFKGKKD